MQIGMVGLGRMGANMARRLHRDEHEVVGYDVVAETVDALAADDIITGARSLRDLVSSMDTPRSIWMMVPVHFVPSTVDELAPLLETGDVIIDGGNSFYQDDIDISRQLADGGIHYLDAGVSGGVWGLENGYSLMIGGDEEPVNRLAPIFSSLAPGLDAAPRTPGRTGDPAPEEEGWLHCGPSGAGHFVKMVHNGIEYGIMAAISEGFAILERADVGTVERELDAETTPLRNPEYYQFDFDLASVAEVWRRGTVIRSWLIDLAAAALQSDGELEGYEGFVSDSGEGRWTVNTAVHEGVPASVIAAALYQRFSSRDQGDFGDKLLSALREQFGGHSEKSE
ncbi:MAG: decarboxylating 6-phosphogluconate dehydrogenase [Acidimicrobiia bacterium]|nr:decarboxylating 6-phosphogluconate dehydrogenase [Acidimicrobiia bacterium]